MPKKATAKILGPYSADRWEAIKPVSGAFIGRGVSKFTALLRALASLRDTYKFKEANGLALQVLNTYTDFDQEKFGKDLVNGAPDTYIYVVIRVTAA